MAFVFAKSSTIDVWYTSVNTFSSIYHWFVSEGYSETYQTSKMEHMRKYLTDLMFDRVVNTPLSLCFFAELRNFFPILNKMSIIMIIIIIIITIIIIMIMYCYEISIKNRFQKQRFTGVLSNSCSEKVRIICKTHFLMQHY